jgi:hypothetical protein
MVWPRSEEAVHDPVTGVPLDVLEKVGRASVKVPEGYVSNIRAFTYCWRARRSGDKRKLTLWEIGNPFEAPTSRQESTAEC